MLRLTMSDPVGRWTNFGDGSLVHGFSTRRGGVSEGPYASLNVGLHVGDDPDRVLENRRRLVRALEIDLDATVFAEQVHGSQVVVVSGDRKGAGAYGLQDAVAGADGLVTAEPGVYLAVMCADCAPVYLFDPIRRAVGIVHAGWRGTAARIASKTVDVMRRAFQTRPEDLRIAIGPAIGPCCYTVGRDVIARFQEAGLGSAVQHGKLDLAVALRTDFMSAGVPATAIVDARLCTCCEGELFFSYRRQGGRAGRMAAVIGLRP